MHREIAAVWCGRRGHDVVGKLEHLCDSEEKDSMYSFIGATTGFEGARA